MGAPVVHFEIGCRDTKKSGAFYSQLLGWELTDYGPARMVNTGTKEGIMGHFNALGHEPFNYITIYAQVDNLETYLAKAEQLGGKTLVPPTEVPGMGHFAWLKDPEGTVFGLWKPMNKA
jgi:predicted enzyme related to lactoylglutathione lyase